jgi:hypothetical protein
MAKRYDSGNLSKPERLPNGWLRVDGFITRVGIFTYRNPDGTERKELRLPEEVFRTDSLATFSAVPITDDHPPEMLDAANAREHMRGFVTDTPRRDGDRVRTSMLVMDAELIAKMEAGKVQTSCGYECDLDESPGVWNGQRYDAVQKNIRANHVAIVARGRAGDEVRVRMDAAEMVDVPTEKETRMDKITINGTEFEVTADVAKAYAAERADADAKIADATKRADAAEGAADAAKAALDAERAARKDAQPVDVQSLIDARLTLVDSARKVLGDEFDARGKSDREIKLAVLDKRGVPAAKFDGASDDRVDGAFVTAVETLPTAADAARSATAEGDRVSAEQSRKDTCESDLARERMLKRNRGEKVDE